ncbi:MAG: glycosyltransferase family 39 protein, partial [Kiritimatiellae bacterium]|nr:glycosyltransferase family 39 protein [Kiritimatiellia bacterium]
MTPQHPYRRPRVVTWASIGLIMAVGAFLRLADLGASAFRADTMEVWRLCHSPHSAATLFSDWLDIVGRTAQFPFAFAFTKGFIEFLGLSPTDTIIRLPSALWGLVAIPFAYLAGAALGRRKFGLFFALLFALSPLHIQISREAYVYAPLQAGCVLLLWSAAWTWHYRRLRQPFPARYFVLSGVGFFLACYSHLSGWWLAALVVPFTLGVLMWRRIKQSRGWREVVALVGVYGVLGAPLLFLPWAVPY